MTYLTPHEVAVALEACAFAAVTHTAPWEINRHGVVIGEIAWDECDCGQLVVSETRRYPATAFPLEEVDHTAECNEPWLVIQYTLSLTRCVPISGEDLVPPAVSLLTASAAQNSDDMTEVRRALMCCLSQRYDANEVAAFELGSQEVAGPGGGCAGFTMTVLVGWTNDCDC